MLDNRIKTWYLIVPPAVPEFGRGRIGHSLYLLSSSGSMASS
jgi:hypothetical protein